MNTVFQYKSVESSKSLESFTTNKILKLVKKYEFIIRADIFFNKEHKNVQKGNICGIRLSLPGPRIYASSNENSFENSISKTIEDLKIQLEKRKVKLYKSLN